MGSLHKHQELCYINSMEKREASSHLTSQEIYHHLSFSSVGYIQSTPSHLISLRSILILSTDLRVGLPSGLFLSSFPTKILYVFLVSPVRATYPAHRILLGLITL
jgi:hypothetical protein